jgi:thiol-disulfide isomerase/thioredoxin
MPRLLALLALASGCSGGREPDIPEEPPPPAVEADVRPEVRESELVSGIWEAALESRGGPIRFRMDVSPDCAVALLVADRRFPTQASCEAGSLSLRFSPYLGSLTARIENDGTRLRGQWDSPKDDGWRHIPFEADPLDEPRTYDAPPATLPEQVTLDVAGKQPVVLELQQVEGPEHAVYATVSSPVGDWGPLEGGFSEGVLALSGFDGSHAFRLQLEPSEGGLAGHVWSKDAPPRALTPSTASVDLDGWDDVAVSRVDLSGVRLPRVQPGSSADEALPTGGPRIVHFTGTWCPNCNDQAPVLEALGAKYPDITLVGLSWEAGAPPAKADRQILRFIQKFDVQHAVYRIDRALPFLDPVPAWPTTLFVRDDGTVSAVHVGFLGPSSAHHDALVARYDAEAAKLLE